MQYFDRSKVPPPQELRSDAARAERRSLRDLIGEESSRRSQSEPKRLFEFSTETLDALRLLFHGKCAFCEARRPLNIHHFRPQAEAEPLDASPVSHLYYAWLRTDWNNVYAACEACSRSGRRYFPVRGPKRGPLPEVFELEHFADENYGVWRWPHRDKPWLLDPCGARSFATHLSFDLAGGITAHSRAGVETISTFALDRDELKSSRKRAFDDYIHLLRQGEWEEADDTAMIFDFQSLEFGGAWYLLLRRLAARITEQTDLPLDLDRRRMPDAYRRLLGTPIGRDAFGSGVEDVRLPPAQSTRSAPRRTKGARRLTGGEIKNFKSLELIGFKMPDAIPEDLEVGHEAEASALLILGENATGKSSMLEAVALSLCGPAIRQRLGRAPGTFVLNPDMMGLLGGPKPAGSGVILHFDDGTSHEFSITTHFDDGDTEGSLPSVFAYGAFRHYGSDARRRPRLGRVGSLFKPSIVLPNPEAWLLRLDEVEFGMVARALRRLFTVEGEFSVIDRDPANERCLIVTRVGSGDEAKEVKTPLGVVSSGFRSVLAMVCDIFEGLLREKAVRERGFSEAEPVILIDEIEAHLHPRWKMQIMAAFRRVFPRAILIATTHDPLCLRGMHDGEVIVLSRGVREEATAKELPVIIEKMENLPDVENLTIEQLLTSDLFSMFSTDSPAAERKLAELGSLLAKRAAGTKLTAEETSALEFLEREVAQSLPLGSSEVQRLVQKAIADYLARRRELSVREAKALEEETRRMIVSALEGY